MLLQHGWFQVGGQRLPRMQGACRIGGGRGRLKDGIVLCQDCAVTALVVVAGISEQQESRDLGLQAVRSEMQAWIVGGRRRFSAKAGARTEDAQGAETRP